MAVVCNPNNPTGDASDPDALSEFAARCRGAGTELLADEAFLGFTDLLGRGHGRRRRRALADQTVRPPRPPRGVSGGD